MKLDLTLGPTVNGGGRPIQLDPPGCGCTECLTGEYLPIDRADTNQIMAMLDDTLGNGTGWEKADWVFVVDGGGGVLAIVHPWMRDDLMVDLRGLSHGGRIIL